MNHAATSSQPEDLFVDAFTQVFGFEKAQLLIQELEYQDFLGNGRLVQPSAEGLSPEPAVGNETSVAADQTGGLACHQRPMAAFRQHNVQADIEIGGVG